MPKKTCAATIHDGDTRCVNTDPEHFGNHRSADGHEWFNERDLAAPPGD